MSIFVQSINTRNAAEKLTRANAAAQKFSERLYAKTLPEVLPLQTTLSSYEGFYLTFKAIPMGSMDNAASYAQIVFDSSGGCTLAGPDGKYALKATAPYNISFTATASAYTLTCDGTTISGGKSSGNAAVLVYAMQKPTSATTTVTLQTGTKALLYCTEENAAKITVSGGTTTTYQDVSLADKCLLRTVTEIYKDSAGKDKLTTIEGIIQVSNTGGAS